jgi:enoyl-CoA hydratase/carnithine racemase
LRIGLNRVPDFETIIYGKKGNIAFVTLNRPRVLNAYNIKMRDELFEVLGAIGEDDDIRAAVLNGAGEKAFCAGADLTEFLSAPSPVIARQVRFQRDLWSRFLGVTKPLIAALHGFVFGSGVEIALCCDIRLASEDVQFGLPEPRLGIIPAAGGSQTLPRVVGLAPALEILLSGRRVKADEAYRIKLVNRVVKREELLSEAGRLAELIAGFSPDVISRAKQAVTRGLDLGLREGLELEARLGTGISR